jgi:long-chain acyl-CoA synthetase
LSADTFPKLLLENARVRGRRPAIREKDLGIWQTWTWEEVAREVRAFACGLAANGFRRGDRLALVGDNRPRLYWAMAAAQSLGGIPVPLYQDAVAREMLYPLEQAEIRFAVAEDQEQVDKLLEIRDRSRVEHIIYDDPRGLAHYDAPGLISYEHVLGLGRLHGDDHPTFFDAQVAQGAGGDVAIILYTSGTTGHPKGVVLTHDNLIITGRNAALREGLSEKDELLAYLPMAWVGDNLFSYAQAWSIGFCVSCPESSDTVLQDMREIGPTYNFAPPRIYESMLTQVLIRIEDASRLKRWLFRYFMEVAKRAGTRLLDGKPVSLRNRALYALGRVLVYGPVKNVLGLTRIRLAYTAGEAIGPDLFDFYRSLGINMKQLYGQTEGAVFVCIQPDGQVKSDTVGTPATEVEVKVTENGEVLYRGPGVFTEYYKNPEATAQTKDADGWVHTGDAGFFDEDGQLKIIDRANDVGRLNDGTLFAPKYIENKLKFFPYIREAVAFGDRRAFVAAFVNIDLAAVGNWAERRHLPYTGHTDLAGKAAVYDLVRDCVEQANRDLAKDPKLGGSQIQRFLILHKELDADDGELTRTRKVRRGFIAEKYGDLIEALYSARESCTVDARVRFEDGRVGQIRADVPIREAKTYPVR